MRCYVSTNRRSLAFCRVGGIEAFEEQLQAEENAKEEKRQEAKDRKNQISSKTRSRLNQLLGRKKAEESSRLQGSEPENE